MGHYGVSTEPSIVAGDNPATGNGNGTPSFTPPLPTPVNGMPTTQLGPNPMRPGMVAPAGYPPMMYPQPNAGYYPMQMPNGGFPVGLPMNPQSGSFGAINAFSGE
jgi:hypothetical protein